jgi:uncharacterized protein DUF6220
MTPRPVLFAVVAWLFLAGVIVQVFLAGMGLFELTDWTNHGALGWLLSMVSFLLPLVAFASGVRRGTFGLALALMAVTLLQPELALARHDNPVVAALHPVNALLLFFLAWRTAMAAVRELRRTDWPALAPKEAAPTQAAALPVPEAPSGQEPSSSPSTSA